MLSRKVIRMDDSPSSVRQTLDQLEMPKPGRAEKAGTSPIGLSHSTPRGQVGQMKPHGLFLFRCLPEHSPDSFHLPQRQASRDILLNYCHTRDYTRCRVIFGRDGIVLIATPGDVITVVGWNPHRPQNGSGRGAEYFGETVTADDADEVLIRWTLEDGSTRVIYGDLRVENILDSE